MEYLELAMFTILFFSSIAGLQIGLLGAFQLSSNFSTKSTFERRVVLRMFIGLAYFVIVWVVWFQLLI